MRKPTVPHTRAISANVPKAAHSIGSEPLNVVEPLTVAMMPRIRIIEAQRNRISSLNGFSGSRKRMAYLEIHAEYARINDRSLPDGKHNYNLVDVELDFRF